MQDFPANSAKARARAEEPPPEMRTRKIEQITSVTAEQRKKGLGRRFKDTFINADGRTTLEYMMMDFVVPGIRDMVFDAFQGGLERMIYGESRIRRGAPPPNPYVNRPHVDYGSYSSTRPTQARTLSQRARTRHDFSDIVIPHRSEAEDVLDHMYEELSRYGSVPVAFLYALTGIQTSHADHKWGWTSLRGAKIARMGNGAWLLDLPAPESLDR